MSENLNQHLGSSFDAFVAVGSLCMMKKQINLIHDVPTREWINHVAERCSCPLEPISCDDIFNWSPRSKAMDHPLIDLTVNKNICYRIQTIKWTDSGNNKIEYTPGRTQKCKMSWKP
jgi:hypothetical protein